MSKHIHKISNNGFTWVNVTKNDQATLKEVAEEYKLEQEDVTACLPPLQRPKITPGANYLFMILLFPIYNRETGEIESTEVDFFIHKNYLITVHDNSLVPLRRLFQSAKERPSLLKKYLKNGPGSFLAHIMDSLFQYCYPILIHISQDIDNIEKRVFEIHNQKVTFEIMRLKTNVVEFKSNTALYDYVIKKLVRLGPAYFNGKATTAKISALIEDSKEIRASLENYAETINAINDTHQSLINLRANQIMKNLQIFAVVVFPLTLLAAIFGMNTLGGMPFFNHPYGFWLIVAIMLCGTFVMLMFFKWRKWY